MSDEKRTELRVEKANSMCKRVGMHKEEHVWEDRKERRKL